MSAKTYAGLNRVRPGSMTKTLAQDGYSVVPLRGTDESDVIFRSRLGAPSNGSGPWMCVRRVVDPNTPSTDGFGNIAAGPDTASNYGLTLVDYRLFVSITAYVLKKTSTRPKSWSYSVKITEYEWIEKSGPRQYTYKADIFQMSSNVYEAERPCSLGFTEEDIKSCYLDNDMMKAYSILTRVLSNRSADAATISRDDKGALVNITQGSVYTLFLDIAPPEAVYLEYREDAELYLLTGILPGHWAMAWETAYIEAGKNLPQSATNVAANVLEAAEILTALLTGRFLASLPKTAREAWLAYRYAYTTTKLDVREFQEVFNRLDTLAHAQRVPTYGSYVRDGVIYRVGYEVNTAQIIPSDVSTTLQKFGLQLNALNVWDMIPFSFVVDWFLPISDIIEYFQNIDACRYEPEDLWWSLTTVKDGYEIYVRLPGRKLSTMPYLQLSKAGSKTIALRIADAVALFAP